MISFAALKARQEAFGPLVEVDFRRYGFVDAHRALGEEVRAQALKILAHRLDSLDIPALAAQIQQVRLCQGLLEATVKQVGLEAVIRQAIEEYLACIQAWARGLGLGEFEHPSLVQEIDGQKITELDLAFLLQHDNVGCQTGLYRCKGGDVILWHAEEDVAEPGERFDVLRIAIFALPEEAGGGEIRAFIYPDLLPGPAFAWRSDGYVQAADTINLLSQPGFEQAALVNIACWLALRLGVQVELKQIVQALAPYWDGYALNTACLRNQAAQGDKCEFARDQAIYWRLGEAAGDFLFQVNIFCNRRSRALQAIEALPVERRRHNAGRIYRTRRRLGGSGLLEPGDEMEYFYRLLGWRAGGEMAYANRDVRAWFLARISLQGMDVRAGPGAVIDPKPGGQS
jgi:hypothetical protein